MDHANRLTIETGRKLGMTPGLRQAIALIGQTGAELAFTLELACAVNPMLTLAAPGPPPPSRGLGGMQAEATPEAPPGLAAHVLAQLGLYVSGARQTRIAHCLIAALEPSGWLGRDLPGIAAGAGCTVAEAERVLACLQEMEPPGLFARSLAECLRLQLRDADLMDAAFAVILDRLDLVATGRVAELATRAGVAKAEIGARIRRLRGLDPKPGAGFAQGAEPLPAPDLTLRHEGAGWAVEWNESALPQLHVNDDIPVEAAQRRTLLAEARALQRAVELRRASGLAVVAEIVRRQSGHLADPACPLAPLVRQDVADTLGLHVSTVARIAQHLTLDTPDGMRPLRSLFSRRLKGAARPASTAQLRARLAALIAGEPRATPLSDACLAQLLTECGFPVARRTVAAHRAALGLPAASRRR